jgi:hypothetical protein
MYNRRSALPSLWAILFLAACCALSMVITLRARAQNAAAAQPAATAPASTARPPASRPEESATIPDDPTLVPDDKESADNNVSFPVDI